MTATGASIINPAHIMRSRIHIAANPMRAALRDSRNIARCRLRLRKSWPADCAVRSARRIRPARRANPQSTHRHAQPKSACAHA